MASPILITFKTSVSALEFFVRHHRINCRALHRGVAEDIHNVRGRSALFNYVVAHVVSEAMRVHIRHVRPVAISPQHFAHSFLIKPLSGVAMQAAAAD